MNKLAIKKVVHLCSLSDMGKLSEQQEKEYKSVLQILKLSEAQVKQAISDVGEKNATDILYLRIVLKDGELDEKISTSIRMLLKCVGKIYPEDKRMTKLINQFDNNCKK